jgi:hypothetical protein
MSHKREAGFADITTTLTISKEAFKQTGFYPGI